MRETRGPSQPSGMETGQGDRAQLRRVRSLLRGRSPDPRGGASSGCATRTPHGADGAGSMLVVPLSEEELEQRLGTDLSLACVNAPGLCVASGPVDALVQLQDELAQSGVDATRVSIGFAAHSKLIDPVLDTFSEFLHTLRPKSPRIPVVSGVTGQWLTEEDATDPGYWVRNLRQPVRFAEGMALLLREPDGIFLEVGPGTTLTSLGKLQPSVEETHTFVHSLRHPQSDAEDAVVILKSLGKLWLAGADIDWAAYHVGQRPPACLAANVRFSAATLLDGVDGTSGRGCVARWNVRVHLEATACGFPQRNGAERLVGLVRRGWPRRSGCRPIDRRGSHGHHSCLRR